MSDPRELDLFDRKILLKLTADGRMSWRDLGDAIGLSLTPTLRRVRRLETDGYISGYSAILDQERLVGGMTVFISVTMERQIDDILAVFESRILSLPEVIGGFLMTGSADYLLQAVVRSLQHYQILLAELTRTPGVAHIQSSFSLKTVVRRNAIPV